MKRGLTLVRLLKKVVRVSSNILQRWRDSRSSTFQSESTTAELGSYFHLLSLDDLKPYTEQIAGLAHNYLNHRFNLLGSGWVQVQHGMDCIGVEGYRYPSDSMTELDAHGEWLQGRMTVANLPRARQIWQLIDRDYVPIDWHRDFKSGYRWSEMTWYRDIPFGHLPGVDVKVPWELARMQHLPTLAWAHHFAQHGDTRFAEPRVYVQEFQNLVRDFIATNPPRFGVNWTTNMDVAIRAANWLVAFDLFRAGGAEFDEHFVREFGLSVFQHGEHIITNLEWTNGLRSNHYLSNIVGLLFVAAYLPPSPKVNTWLAFALQELHYEILAQFHPDGSNFEGATSYHRLSAEMVIYAMAIALGLPVEKRDSVQNYAAGMYRLPRPLPDDPAALPVPWAEPCLSRIERMAEFTMHITRPPGRIPQFGDNDSGRFLKMIPTFTARDPERAVALYGNLNGYSPPPDMPIFWDEDTLDHRHLVAAINGLFQRKNLQTFSHTPEMLVVSQIAGQVQPSYLSEGGAAAATSCRVGDNWTQALAQVPDGPYRQHYEFSGSDLMSGLQTFGYPDFGLYIFRSSRLYLAVRCGSIGQAGNGGHAHNDQLGIELVIDGEEWIVDPGTYLYTPLPARRQAYRSVRAHFVPQAVTGEPGDMSIGLFALGDEAQARCLYFDPEGFIGMHRGYGAPVFRVITLADDAVLIDDASAQVELVALPHAVWPPDDGILYSPAYGVKRR